MSRILSTCFSVLVLWQVFLQAEEFNASDLGNNWYEHEQFGTFYEANNSDWYYHIDHGWIYVDEWDNNGTWMYMPLVDETPFHPYMHFDGNNYTAVIDWDELATSTGLSLEFLKAIIDSSGIDPSLFENEGNQTINVTDTAEPFGWAWTKSLTQNYFYNNRLEEWFYFNKDIPKSEARFYSYNQKCYVTPKEIRKRVYAQDVWRKMLSKYGLEKLNDLNRSVGIDENKLDFSYGTPVIITVNIPKSEIQEDDLWFPLIETLTEQQIVLKKYYRLFEDENFYRLEIRSVFFNEGINSSSHESTNDTQHGDDAPDDERQASAKGLDDNLFTEAIALEKVFLIDLNDDEQSAKADYYIEVAVVASNMFEEKVAARRSGRGNSGKSVDDFISDLVYNFEYVVDVTIEADTIGVKDEAMFDSLLENAENAPDVKEVVQVASTIGAKDKAILESVFKNVAQTDSVIEIARVAADLGIQDKENLGSVFMNANKADDLKAVMNVAKEALGAYDATGSKKLDSSKASILSSTLKNADKATELKSVLAIAIDLGVQDAENLIPVFKNSDQAADLLEVLNSADEAGVKDKVTFVAIFQNLNV